MEYEVRDSESVSTAVVRAVSAVTGKHPDSIQPLDEVLDPDALDDLFTTRATGGPRIGGRLTFVFANCRITIDNGEFLAIHPLVTEGLSESDRPGA